MPENGIAQPEEKSRTTSESSSGTASEIELEERHHKNAEKKARQFNFEEIFKSTCENAKFHTAEKETNDPINEKSTENQADSSFDQLRIRTERTSIRDDVEKIESTLPKNLGKVSANDVNSADEYDVPLPSGFVVDTRFKQNEGEAEAVSSKEEELPQNEDEEFDDFGEGIPVVDLIPTTCEATLNHGQKPVSALAFDQQGTAFATGGFDYAANIYEFQQMDVSLRPTRELMPCESHIINGLAFSSNGEYLLVASGHAQIRVLNRQGKQFAETIRGDQYLVDLSNTKGHTGSVNACCWHPVNKKEFLSCADDGTLRIWSLDDFKELTRCINKQRKVIKTKNAGGKRAIPTSCTYSRDGKFVAAGCNDGSIQIWKHGNLYVNTTYLNRTAHTASVTSLQFSPNGQKLLSRSMDGTMKLWCLSSFKKPELTISGLETDYNNTDCGFSPHGEIVFTGTAADLDNDVDGYLLFYNSSNFELLYKITFPKVSCIRIAWHPKINQILVGLSDGSLRLYYDTTSSVRGALLCVTRPLKRARQKEVIREEMVLSPLALEMFQPRGEEGEEKEVTTWRLKKYLRMQDNKLRPDFRRPAEMPMSGPSSGGRVAASGGTLHSYIAKELGTKRNRDFLADNDVRASILRHAEEAERNPLYVANAYKKNQPVAIFQEKTTAPEEEEPDTELRPIYKIPKLQ